MTADRMPIWAKSLAILLGLAVIVSQFWQAGTVEAQVSLQAEINKSFNPINISAGGVSTLSVIVYNPNNFALTLSTDPVAWSDTLPVGLDFASPSNAATTCGGTITMVGRTLSLLGGTVPAKSGGVSGSCMVSVDVTSTTAGNHENIIPANTLIATDPSGTISVTNSSLSSTTLQVAAVQIPSISKAFSSNTIWVNQPTTATLTLNNTDTGTILTGVSVTDLLPANITLASAPAASQCGGTVTSGVDAATSRSYVTLTGGSIPKKVGSTNGTCTVTFSVISTTAGVYNNIIPAGTMTTTQGVSNTSAASAPLNVQDIGIQKSFSPSNFMSGGSSTVTLTIRNPTGNPYTGIIITDSMLGGLTVASAPASPQCNGGTVTYTANSVTLTDGSLPAGSPGTPSSCTVQFQVTASTAATYTNGIAVNDLHTNEGPYNVITTSTNVLVYASGAGLTGSKSFSPAAIEVGANTRLRLTLTAPADIALTNFSVFDALPDGMTISNSTAASTSGCGAGSTLSAPTGGTSISLSGGAIAAGASCQINVYVTSSKPGSWPNTVSAANISNTQNRNLSTNISASLTVSGLTAAQAFYPTRVGAGGVSRLTITLTNTNLAQLDSAALNAAILASGITVADDPAPSNTCGATFNPASGDQSLVMTGGTIPAKVGSVNGICTLSVNIKGVGANNSYNSTIAIGAVTGTLHGTTTTVSNLSQVQTPLTIGPVSIEVVKGFSPTEVFGGSSSVMTIRLINPNAVALAGITFTDNLPQGTNGGMKVASPPGISTGACGGTLVAPPGATSISYSGGGLADNSNCDITLNITMNVNNNLINTIPVGAVTTTTMASNTQAATATLTNLPGVSLSKAFSPNPISTGAGATSILTITIQNLGSATLTGMGFTDTLPGGLQVAAAPAPVNNCGGNLTADAGTNTIQLSNGTIDGILNPDDPAKTCTIMIAVSGNPATGLAAGNYENCMPIGSLITADSSSNTTAACDTLKAVAPPTIAKAFSASPVAANQAVGLTFTITNPAANTSALTGVSFTDTFPAGMTLASVPNASQCGGTVVSTASSVTLTGGSIAVNSNCIVTVSVKASPGGPYTNTSGPVSSTEGGAGNTATANLNVVSPPTISKIFAPNPIAVGGTSVITFTLTNPLDNTVALSGVAFSDTFPAGLTRASVPAVTQCNGGTVSSTTGSVTLTGGSIPIGGACQVVVQVTAGGGSYPNTTSAVSSTNGGTGLTASDTLTVTGSGLSLDKTTASSGFQTAGNVITYSYELTNTGDIMLHAPFLITDDHIGSPSGTPFTCGAAVTLAHGAKLTCTADYTVQPADVTAKSMTNIASATAVDNEISGHTTTSNSDSVTVQLQALSIRKTTTSAGYRTAGNTIAYNYTLTNSGAVTLYPPFRVADDHIGSPLGTPFDCGSGTSLPPGGNLTCSQNYTVTDADLSGPGYVMNTARGTAMNSTGGTVTSPNSSVTVYRVVAPTISKAFSPNPAPVGSVSMLTFTITNPATNVVPLTGVGFTDTLPAGMTVAITADAAQCGGTVTANLGSASITFTGGTVLPAPISTCTVVVPVTVAARGSYPNTSGNVTSTNGGNGTVPAVDTLVVVAPPTISKAFSPTSILVGGTSTMTFTLTNSDPTAGLTGVAFNDILPAGLVIDSAPASPQCGGTVTSTAGTITLTGGSIAASASCTLTATVRGTTIGTKNNTTGQISSTEGGTGATSNTATITVDQPALILAKSVASGSPYDSAGDLVEYNYIVQNSGNVTLIGNGVGGLFTVTDNKATVTCPATPTGLAPGQAITCTGSYAVVQADLDTGSVTNIATAHGLFNGAAVTSNDDSEIAYATQTPGLTLAKSITSGALYNAVGNVVQYRYVLTNSGNVTLTGIAADGRFTVDDDKTIVTCPATPTSLAPAQTVTCTGSYTITQADLDAKSLTNIARGHSRFGAAAVDSNIDSRTANGNPTPVLTLDKTITSGDPFLAAGDPVAFSYLLTNNGNVTLRGTGPGNRFTITDDKTTVDCPLTPTSLAPGLSLTCSSSYIITAADRTNESVTNTARAPALEPGGVTVLSNIDTATVNVRRGEIRGVVFNDVDVSGTREATELGIGGVTVNLYDSTGATLLATTIMAADGTYTFTNLLPRTYRVVESDPAGYVSSTTNTLNPTVDPGGISTADYGEYKLDRSLPASSSLGSVAGVVFEDLNSSGVREPGEPAIPAVVVTLLDASGATVDSALTGPDGRFRFNSLASGRYTVVETNPAGYTSTTLDHVGVAVTPGSLAEVPFGDVVSGATFIDPAVTKFGSPTSARIGDRVVYTITVGNNSTTDALDVVLTDTKPAFLDIIEITVSPDEGFPVTITGSTFTIDFGTVEPTDFFIVTVLTVVNDLGAAPGGENVALLSTSSAPDLVSNNRATANLFIAPLNPREEEEEELPTTGFAPGIVTLLPPRPAGAVEQSGGLEIDIPALGIRTTIVGLEKQGATWDVTWLGRQLGYLNGTAYPTFKGNSVITGHVYGADGLPGPFVNLEKMKWGDQLILHSYNQDFIYEIRAIREVSPQDTSAFDHQEEPWITLVTCKQYDLRSGLYLKRVLAQAVLVRVVDGE